MKKKHSFFKDPEKDLATFNSWVKKLEQMNGYEYDKRAIQTSLGRTQVYGLNTNASDLETLVIFPGFRTSSLIWDLDSGLQDLSKHLRIFLIETNGQPNLSEGNSPSIKSLDYGIWASEVLEQLKVKQTFVAGASFGGLVSMKLALVSPHKVKEIFLLNPACLGPISLNPYFWYNALLPVVSPSHKNIQRFLDKVVFCKPSHALSNDAESLLLEYLRLAIKSYKDNTEKPYYMRNQLDQIKTPTHLLVGDKDPLFSYGKSIQNAKKHLGKFLKQVEIFKNVGHGNECYRPCMDYIGEAIYARNNV